MAGECYKMPVNEDDKQFLREKYHLSEEEVFEAVKLYYRTTMSLCQAARVIISRRYKGGA